MATVPKKAKNVQNVTNASASITQQTNWSTRSLSTSTAKNASIK